MNKVWIAVCDRTGPERGIDWAGASVVVDPDGWLAAGPWRAMAAGSSTPTATSAVHATRHGGSRRRGGDLRPELYALDRADRRAVSHRAARERTFEDRFFERARREAVTRFLGAWENELTGRDTSEREDDGARGDRRFELRREDIAEPSAVLRARQLEVVADLDAGAVEAGHVDVALYW